MHCVSTIGGPRLLINLRAAYYLPTRKPTSTRAGFPEHSYEMETQGTVGEFRCGGVSTADGDSASVGMGENVPANNTVAPEPSIQLTRPKEADLESRGIADVER